MRNFVLYEFPKGVIERSSAKTIQLTSGIDTLSEKVSRGFFFLGGGFCFQTTANFTLVVDSRDGRPNERV